MTRTKRRQSQLERKRSLASDSAPVADHEEESPSSTNASETCTAGSTLAKPDRDETHSNSNNNNVTSSSSRSMSAAIQEKGSPLAKVEPTEAKATRILGGSSGQLTSQSARGRKGNDGYERLSALESSEHLSSPSRLAGKRQGSSSSSAGSNLSGCNSETNLKNLHASNPTSPRDVLKKKKHTLPYASKSPATSKVASTTTTAISSPLSKEKQKQRKMDSQQTPALSGPRLKRPDTIRQSGESFALHAQQMTTTSLFLETPCEVCRSRGSSTASDRSTGSTCARGFRCCSLTGKNQFHRTDSPAAAAAGGGGDVDATLGFESGSSTTNAAGSRSDVAAYESDRGVETQPPLTQASSFSLFPPNRQETLSFPALDAHGRVSQRTEKAPPVRSNTETPNERSVSHKYDSLSTSLRTPSAPNFSKNNDSWPESELTESHRIRGLNTGTPTQRPTVRGKLFSSPPTEFTPPRRARTPKSEDATPDNTSDAIVPPTKKLKRLKWQQDIDRVVEASPRRKYSRSDSQPTSSLLTLSNPTHRQAAPNVAKTADVPGWGATEGVDQAANRWHSNSSFPKAGAAGSAIGTNEFENSLTLNPRGTPDSSMYFPTFDRMSVREEAEREDDENIASWNAPQHWSVFYPRGIAQQPPIKLHYLAVGGWRTVPGGFDYFNHRNLKEGEAIGHSVTWLHNAKPQDRFVFVIDPVELVRNAPSKWWSIRHRFFGDPPAFSQNRKRFTRDPSLLFHDPRAFEPQSTSARSASASITRSMERSSSSSKRSSRSASASSSSEFAPGRAIFKAQERRSRHHHGDGRVDGSASSRSGSSNRSRSISSLGVSPVTPVPRSLHASVGGLSATTNIHEAARSTSPSHGTPMQEGVEDAGDLPTEQQTFSTLGGASSRTQRERERSLTPQASGDFTTSSFGSPRQPFLSLSQRRTVDPFEYYKSRRNVGVEVIEVLHSEITALDYNPRLVSSRLAIEAKAVYGYWFNNKKDAYVYYGCEADLDDEEYDEVLHTSSMMTPPLRGGASGHRYRPGMASGHPLGLESGASSRAVTPQRSPRLRDAKETMDIATRRFSTALRSGMPIALDGSPRPTGTMPYVDPASPEPICPSMARKNSQTLASTGRNAIPSVVEEKNGRERDSVRRRRNGSTIGSGKPERLHNSASAPVFPSSTLTSKRSNNDAGVKQADCNRRVSQAMRRDPSTPLTPVVPRRQASTAHFDTIVSIYSDDPHFNAVLREVLLPEPGTFPYTASLKEQRRMLSLYETGMPTWTVFLASTGLPYRRVLRLLFVGLVNVWPLISLFVGLYDLYKHMPQMREFLAGTVAPLTEWIERRVTLRVSVMMTYLLSVTFTTITSLSAFFHSVVVYYIPFLYWPYVLVKTLFSLLWYPFDLTYNIVWTLLMIGHSFVSLLFLSVKLIIALPFLLVSEIGSIEAIFGATRATTATVVEGTSLTMKWWQAWQEFWVTTASPVKNLAKAWYDSIVHMALSVARREASIRRWYTPILVRILGVVDMWLDVCMVNTVLAWTFFSPTLWFLVFSCFALSVIVVSAIAVVTFLPSAVIVSSMNPHHQEGQENGGLCPAGTTATAPPHVCAPIGENYRVALE